MYHQLHSRPLNRVVSYLLEKILEQRANKNWIFLFFSKWVVLVKGRAHSLASIGMFWAAALAVPFNGI